MQIALQPAFGKKTPNRLLSQDDPVMKFRFTKREDGSLETVAITRDSKPIKKSWYHKVIWPLASFHAGRFIYRRVIKRALYLFHFI